MSDEPNFTCPEDEIAYWKRLAQEHKRREEEAREELDEFQMSSRELEAELEAQLEQAEQNMRELRSNNGRLQMEVENLQERLESLHATSHKQISDLEEELLKVKGFKDELQKYIRELEQSNDDLERTKRVTVVSLEDFEARLNMAIERNAFLESELEEREGMHVTVQRLKDEARDLRQELQVCKKDETVSVTGREVRKMASEFDKVEPMEQIDSNKLAESGGDAYITPVTPQRPVLHHSANGSPLTPSARISALNIVGDLLRKIGALESKLASCRNFVKDQPRSNKSGSTSPLNSPRAKRLHRSATIGAAPVSTT